MSAQYFPLPRQPEHTALRGLLDAVAPGGTLLFVSHDLADLPPRQEAASTPATTTSPTTSPGSSTTTWTVLINGDPPAHRPAPPGTHHTHDTVLRARRLR